MSSYQQMPYKNYPHYSEDKNISGSKKQPGQNVLAVFFTLSTPCFVSGVSDGRSALCLHCSVDLFYQKRAVDPMDHCSFLQRLHL